MLFDRIFLTRAQSRSHLKDLYRLLSVCCGLLLLSGVLISCSGFGDADNGTSTGSVAAAKVHWCGKPQMIFRDESSSGTDTPAASATGEANATPATDGATTPTTITDWKQVEPKLGFDLYLPATLPASTCLVSVSGTLHDPIFGSSFTIGYLLPDHTALTLSEAPLRSQSTKFQCSPSAQGSSAQDSSTAVPAKEQMPSQICSGAREKTNIVFSVRGTTQKLEQFFHDLQPKVKWLPDA